MLLEPWNLFKLWALTCFVLPLPLREDQVNNKNCCTPSGSVHLFLWCSFIYLALAFFNIYPSLYLFTLTGQVLAGCLIPQLSWSGQVYSCPSGKKLDSIQRWYPIPQKMCVRVCVLGWILGASCSGWDTLSLCRNSIACRAAAGAGCVPLFITNTQALCIPHTHTFPALKHTLLLPIDASMEHLIVFHLALG